MSSLKNGFGLLIGAIVLSGISIIITVEFLWILSQYLSSSLMIEWLVSNIAMLLNLYQILYIISIISIIFYGVGIILAILGRLSSRPSLILFLVIAGSFDLIDVSIIYASLNILEILFLLSIILNIIFTLLIILLSVISYYKQKTFLSKETKPLNPLSIAITAAFTALTFVATFSFQISLPLTRGYFNLGEIVIYVTALAFGPAVGAFTGGVGSMLSDIASGYSYYAPWTLLIKAMEGFVVGYLYKRFKRKGSQLSTISPSETVTLLIFGFLISASIVIIGSAFESDLLYLWIICSGIMVLASFTAVYYIKVNMFRISTSVATGMFVMVLGYFLAEWLVVPGVGLFYAGTEIAPNILECLVGMYLAIPIYQALLKSNILETVSIHPNNPEKIE